MDAQTFIFGYTDADGRDEIVLCAVCGAKFHKAAPNDWRILRVRDAAKYPDGRDCDECGKQIFYKNSPPGAAMSLGYEPHRLKVFEEYLETLDD